jgi:replicative DNA helicase
MHNPGVGFGVLLNANSCTKLHNNSQGFRHHRECVEEEVDRLKGSIWRDAMVGNGAEVMMAKVSKSIQNDTFTLAKYRGLMDEVVKEMDEVVIPRESNKDTILEVMKSHDRAKAGDVNGIVLPFNTFTRVVLLEEVDLMVMGARPAMGKTAWAISCAADWVTKMGLKVVIFALEMSRTQMMRRVLAHQSRVNSNHIKYGEMTEAESGRVMKVWNDELEKNLHIVEGSQTSGDIAAEITRRKADGGCDVVIVDYLQKIRPTNPKQSIFETVTFASNDLKSISQNLRIPIMALAQLSRDSAKAGKRPSLPDLRQSGEIEQDASLVGFIHRPEYYGDLDMESGGSSTGMAEIIIAKNREGDCGIYQMSVDLSTSRFSDVGYEEQKTSNLNEHQPDDENPF